MDFERLFDGSYERVLSNPVNGKDFFERFYERFIQADPRVAQHFANTEMERQRKMLEKSFYKLIVFYATRCSDEYLEQVAVQHSKMALNIEPDLFDLWLDTLIETVREYDPDYRSEIELAWRLVLGSGITYMKFKYDQ